jgi:hypothetical protein
MSGYDSKRQMAADKLQDPIAFDEFLESQDFYELMQTYRHCLTDALLPFEKVKNALRFVHIEAALAQPAQEPVAWIWKDMRGQDIVSLFEPRLNSIPLYTAPPQGDA